MENGETVTRRLYVALHGNSTIDARGQSQKSGAVCGNCARQKSLCDNHDILEESDYRLIALVIRGQTIDHEEEGDDDGDQMNEEEEEEDDVASVCGGASLDPLDYDLSWGTSATSGGAASSVMTARAVPLPSKKRRVEEGDGAEPSSNGGDSEDEEVDELQQVLDNLNINQRNGDLREVLRGSESLLEELGRSTSAHAQLLKRLLTHIQTQQQEINILRTQNVGREQLEAKEREIEATQRKYNALKQKIRRLRQSVTRTQENDRSLTEGIDSLGATTDRVRESSQEARRYIASSNILEFARSFRG